MCHVSLAISIRIRGHPVVLVFVPHSVVVIKSVFCLVHQMLCTYVHVILRTCMVLTMITLCLQDIEYSYEHFKAFFQDFTALDTNTDFDCLSPPDIQGTMIDTPCGHLH